MCNHFCFFVRVKNEKDVPESAWLSGTEIIVAKVLFEVLLYSHRYYIK